MVYAFAVPIRPDKTDAMRRFIAECLGPRKAEYDDMQRRCEVTRETYWLQANPEHGDTAVVVSEGIDNDRTFQAIMADPRTDFDRWYRDQMMDIFDVPGGLNEVVGIYQP